MAHEARKPVLYLLANAFPFGTWEPYLETELSYYGAFERVRLFSLSVRPHQLLRTQIRLPENVTVSPIAFRAKWFYALYFLTCLVEPLLYRELGRLRRRRKLTPARLLSLFVSLSRAKYEAAQIARILRREKAAECDGAVILYSYRMAYQPLLAHFLRKTQPQIRRFAARAHGSDLYEHLAPAKYVPLRAEMLRETDAVYLISEHGLNYLRAQYPSLCSRFRLAKLGTEDGGLGAWSPSPVLRILTCSALVPLKRIDKLIEALALTNIPICWDHFGEGKDEEKLRALAAEKLGEKGTATNVRYTFRGFAEHADLMRHLRRTEYDWFLNVSTSEGIPVSVMEANSFGIPCLATRVGGNPEIVREGCNGELLSADFSAEELAARLAELYALPPERRAAYRAQARRLWEENYRAEKVYGEFVRGLAGGEEGNIG